MEIEINETNKYNTKDIAKWVRQTLKREMPDFKFSVRIETYTGGSSMSITMLRSPVRLLKRLGEIEEQEILRLMNARNDTRDEVLGFIKQRLDSDHHDINQYYVDEDWSLTEKGKKICSKVLDIANKYNWDNSDAMTDYFDVNYYLDLKLGDYDRPFIDGSKEVI